MAKRTDIRAFQAQLAQALLAAQQGVGETAARWLAVEAGRHHLLIPVTETAGVLHEFSLQPVPFAPPAYRGLTNVRGELYDVVDLAAALGDPVTPPAAANRLVLVAAGLAPRVALLVTQVAGLRRETAFRPAAECDPTMSQPTWQDDRGLLWCVLDLRTTLEGVARTFLTANVMGVRS